jgi:hypothetical protein
MKEAGIDRNPLLQNNPFGVFVAAEYCYLTNLKLF